jgi:hypothetical protein
MNEVTRLFQAFVAPAIFVSATALLVLSVNVRLMGIVSRLRHFVDAKHKATVEKRFQEAEAFTGQIHSIESRAVKIQRCFLMSLISLCGSILACLLLGFGLYWTGAAFAAAAVFVVALIALLVAAMYYIAEVTVALSSVRDEARDLRFMDLGNFPGVPGGDGDNAS